MSAPGRHGGRIGTRIRNQTVVVAGQHKHRSQPRNNTRGEIASDAIRHGLLVQWTYSLSVLILRMIRGFFEFALRWA